MVIFRDPEVVERKIFPVINEKHIGAPQAMERGEVKLL